MNPTSRASHISFLLLHFLLLDYSHAAPNLGPFKSDISIPALFVFGDSWVDSGNAKYLNDTDPSSAYGVDFKEGQQIRASNGKTMADFIAQTFGLPLLPPYLSLNKSESIRYGANYASSGCGILRETTNYTHENCLDLDEQIKLFETSLKNLRTPSDLSKSLIFLNIGQNDLDLNKGLGQNGSPDVGKYVAESLSKRLQRLYELGGRKFLVSNSLPLGCRPLSIGLEKPTTPCVERLNKLVSQYNSQLPQILKDLESTLLGSKFVLLDVYKVFEDVFAAPASYGISDISHPCCNVGPKIFIPVCQNGEVCSNRDQYAFFDAIHPTQVMHSIMISRCLKESSICSPINLIELVKA